MGKVIHSETLPLSVSGASNYVLINDFAKKFLTGNETLDEKKYEAHLEYTVSKKGDHYMAVWIEKKK
jgi:hypothetical protein